MVRIKMARRFIPVILLIAMSSHFGLAQTPGRDVKISKGVIHQLRIYEIFDGNKKVFHKRFQDHAMRIMARYDFKIVATWESRNNNRTEFAYLIEWPDQETMKDRWSKFMADQEWAAIKKATAAHGHGPLVGNIAERTLELTDYSPRRRLVN